MRRTGRHIAEIPIPVGNGFFLHGQFNIRPREHNIPLSHIGVSSFTGAFPAGALCPHHPHDRSGQKLTADHIPALRIFAFAALPVGFGGLQSLEPGEDAVGLVLFPQIAIQHIYFKACVLQSLYSRQGESLSGVGDQKTKPLQWKYTLGGKGAA